MIATYNNLLYEKISFNNAELDSKIINDLIKTFKPDRERMIGLWNRYKGQVPIKDRTMPDNYKKNNKIANDYRGTIISQVVGYMYGSPIVYAFDQAKYTDAQDIDIRKYIDNFNKLNNIPDLDAITGEMASVCGYGSRLLYIDLYGLLRIMNWKPWETIFVYDPTIDKMQYAIIYYLIDYYDTIKRVYEKRWKVELYDDRNVTFYFEYEKGKFELDPDEKINPKPHLFKDVPVIKFANNNLENGDFENVESLIDGLDIVISDAQNELEEFRLAYLGIIGGMMDEDDVIRARQTGTFQLPEGMDIKFITKTLQTDFVDKHVTRLKENIFSLSSTIDFDNDVFSGNAESGLSRRLKFQQLESKAIKKERKFEKALYDQYKLLTDIWAMKNVLLDPYDMIFTFNRDLPIDVMYYATAGNMLTGQVSEETKLKLFPFVDDAREEIIRMENEATQRGELIDLNRALDIPASGSN